MDSLRYLANFDTQSLPSESFDILIVGSGLAGMYTALSLAPHLRVAVLAKADLGTSNSRLAQGGIAVSITQEDSPHLHFLDTLRAGAGHCNQEAVKTLVEEGKATIEHLCRLGVPFDKAPDGCLSVGREGAHGLNRIVHVGDATGLAVCEALLAELLCCPNISVFEHHFAVDLLTDGGTRGLLVHDGNGLKVFHAGAVVLASGGYGQLYENTSNPEIATGDGLMLAYRAGASLADLEFIQFHPTVLHHAERKGFLISEAVRGEGAKLLNSAHQRFMPSLHAMGELAPRDVVSRAIADEINRSGFPHVWLDITDRDPEYLARRFPVIFSTCQSLGIDPSRDLIPVSPAAHYCMGGIKTDLDGRTDIEGLYACGEAACTGVHGANRLASNSLLECLVFGKRVGAAINQSLERTPRKAPAVLRFEADRLTLAKPLRRDLQRIMTQDVGIRRNAAGLERAERSLQAIMSKLRQTQNENPQDFELQNLAQLALLTTIAAKKRQESLGAHHREDSIPYPNETIIQKREACHV